jgi:sugar phosphate isomerase/epimerase
MEISQWVEEGARLDLDAVDVSHHFYSTRDRERRIQNTVKALENNSMHIALFNTYSDLTYPDKDIRRKETSNLLEGISTASRLGARWVRLVAGQHYPEINTVRGIAWVMEGFKRAAEKAQEVGIQLVFENHSQPGNWNFPDFAFNPDIFLEICEGIKPFAIGVLFDTANAVAAGENPIDLLPRVFQQTCCIHAADTTHYGIFSPCRIGQGAVPFRELFQYLTRSSFSGYISIEEASFEGKSGIHDAVKFIKETWRRSCLDDSN